MTAMLLLVSALPGCASIAYLGQAISGQLHLLGQQRPIHVAIDDPDLTDDVRSRLRVVEDILAFAAGALHLPAGGNYRTFVQLGAPFVAWNVFAAPPYSLEARRWCYPVTGCAPYHGFFSETAAHAEAERLRANGDDVYVGGVVAYSTLGWFDDPVLSSMLRGGRLDLAALIFHELAHRKFWAPGDIELNESYAETVARIGTGLAAAAWNDADAEAYAARIRQDDEFYTLVLRHKRALQSLYESGRTEPELRAGKELQFDQLRADYRARHAAAAQPDRFTSWIEGDLNNAKLAAVSAYRELVPGLLEIYRRVGGDLALFYREMDRVRGCAPLLRRNWVLSGGAAQWCENIAAGVQDPLEPAPPGKPFP